MLFILCIIFLSPLKIPPNFHPKAKSFSKLHISVNLKNSTQSTSTKNTPWWLQGSGIASIHCRQDFLKHLAQTPGFFLQQKGGWLWWVGSTVIVRRYWGCLVGVGGGYCRLLMFYCYDDCWPSMVHDANLCPEKGASARNLEVYICIFTRNPKHIWKINNLFASRYQLDGLNMISLSNIFRFIKHHLRKSFPARAEVPWCLDVGCVKCCCRGGKDYGNAKGATSVV